MTAEQIARYKEEKAIELARSSSKSTIRYGHHSWVYRVTGPDEWSSVWVRFSAEPESCVDDYYHLEPIAGFCRGVQIYPTTH